MTTQGTTVSVFIYSSVSLQIIWVMKAVMKERIILASILEAYISPHSFWMIVLMLLSHILVGFHESQLCLPQ